MRAAEAPTSEHGSVAAAREGDSGAFERLIAPHRGEIHALCYQMLGSLHDAEDASQEASCAPGGRGTASRGAARSGRGSIALQRTSASTRSPGGPSACFRSTTARRQGQARPTRSARRRRSGWTRTDHSQQDELRRLGDDRLRAFVSRLVSAFEGGHVEAIIALLAEDAVFSMPPYPAWYQGRERIADSWLMPQDSPAGLRFQSTRANGQLALGVYKLDAARDLYVPSCLEVFGLRGELISEAIRS